MKLTLAYSPYGHNPGNISIFSKIFKQQFDAVFEGGLHSKSLHVNADALILWGGTDIHASLYNQRPHITNQTKSWEQPSPRDMVEWHLISEAVRKKIPIIGICRGAQMLCAFAGGSLYQDVKGHSSPHIIETYDGQEFKTSSCHHQMMKIPNTVNHELLAWSADNLSEGHYYEEFSLSDVQRKPNTPEPEVVWFNDIQGLAIQGHPEWQEQDKSYEKFNDWLLDELLTRM